VRVRFAGCQCRPIGASTGLAACRDGSLTLIEPRALVSKIQPELFRPTVVFALSFSLLRLCAVTDGPKTTTVMLAAGALFVVYFPIALWLKYSYVPPRGPPGAVWKLIYFRNYDDSGVAFISYDKKLRELGDTPEAPGISPVVLYEDGKPLGPAHRNHGEIAKFGQGRFSHWATTGFILSASDNSDPRTNGREYWAVIPNTEYRARAP
jgi:hypothetical protein